MTRRVQARGIGEERRAPRLVEGRPHLDPVAERVVHVERVLGEPLRGVADGPAALLLQRLRQVPVVQRQPREDVGIQQLVDEPTVEVDALRVERAAVGAHARPRGGEPVGLQSHALHQRDVTLVPVVVVARHIAVVGVDDGARHAAERIPDRVATAVLVCRALDLVRSGGCAEQEVGREGPGGARAHSGGVLSRDRGIGQGHPFTAPAMMPLTSCLPANRNRIRRGMVARRTPASTIE